MSSKKRGKISITPDGPYQVHGDIPVNLAFIGIDEKGDSVRWDKKECCKNPRGEASADDGVFLCRCGHSKTTPYCDGTHADAGFCGKEKPETSTYRERAEVVSGEAVDLLDDESLCVGARFCDVGQSAWNYAERSGDPENLALAIAETTKCPAGRLTLRQKDGALIEPDLEQQVSATDDTLRNCRGPLWVQGGIEIEGPKGEKYEVRNRVTLCRCGESSNQPFCDGTHVNCEHMQGVDEQ